MNSLLRGVLLDILLTLAAAGLYYLLVVYTAENADLRALFLPAAMLFVGAGFLRGQVPPIYPVIEAGVLISGVLLVILFGTFLPRLILESVAFVAYGSSLAGMYAGRSWVAHARSRGLFIVTVSLGLVEITNAVGTPILAARLTTKTGNVPAAAFSVTRVDGTGLRSAELRGRVAVLDFWATWCPPCWRQFPDLQRLYERYESNPEVIFLAIDANGNGENPEKARDFMHNHGYTIPVAFDDGGALTRLRVGTIPSLLLLDRSGNVRLVHAGYYNPERFVENLSKEIDKLLREEQPGDRPQSPFAAFMNRPTRYATNLPGRAGGEVECVARND